MPRCPICGKGIFHSHQTCRAIKELHDNMQEAMNGMSKHIAESLTESFAHISTSLKHLDMGLMETQMKVNEPGFKESAEFVAKSLEYAREELDEFIKKKLEEEWNRLSEKTEW
jgi:hypothetical protein